MLKPTDGVRRPVDTARRRAHRAGPIARLNARTIGIARRTRAWLHDRAGDRAGRLDSLRASLRPFATTERILPIGVAGAVAVASLLAVLPSTTSGAVGGTSGAGEGVRIAIGGQNSRSTDQDFDTFGGNASYREGTTFTPVVLPDVTTEPEEEAASAAAGNILDDGTLLTGYAPDTDVADGADLVRKYKVRSGDTLSTIANRYDVSMMTLWWANKLKSKDDLHVGQVLRIPPVSGLVVTVGDADTLDSIAAKFDVKPEKVIELNGLEDPTLVVGQVLILPGAKGDPIPTPKPTPKPEKSRSGSGGSGNGGGNGGGSSGGGRGNGGGGGQPTYTGGRFHWPVVGGGNYVSQYAHSGHMALDIAGDYGSSIVAAAGGRVVFAGWKSNGGGWQVWISHGNGVYTTYNHMSGVSVGNGQSVGRGSRVGRLGNSGWATGPHLHFEVWRGGQPWSGGYQVNPMRYF